MKRFCSVLALAAFAVTPAHSQSLGDTFNQFRSTLKQLGGKAKPASETPIAASPAEPEVTHADEGFMVPASVVADDFSDTSLETTPLLPRRIATFDIRGLKLGMSPREVGRITDRQHFRRRWNSIFQTTGTFDLEAARLANLQLNRPIEKSSKVQLKAVQGFDPSGDELKLEFTLEPTGPKLSRIEYRAKLNGTTKEQTFTALVAKYGPANGGDRSIGIISWGGPTKPVENAAPILDAVVDNGTIMLTLDQSVDYIQAVRKQLTDRAQQVAAAKGGGVEF